MSSGTDRSHKIRRHCRQNIHTHTHTTNTPHPPTHTHTTHPHPHTHTHTHTTRTYTHTRASKWIYIISFIIFKGKIQEGTGEWFRLMTNLIHECIDVVAHLIRIWRNEFHCTHGLLPISVNAFRCLHQPNPGEGRCVGSECTSVSYCLSPTIRTQPYYCVIFSCWQR